MLQLLSSFEAQFSSKKGLWEGKKKAFIKIAHFLFLQSLAQQEHSQAMGNLPDSWDLIVISMTTSNNDLCSQLQERRSIISRLHLCSALHNSITRLILDSQKTSLSKLQETIAFTFSSTSSLGSAALTSISDNKKLVFVTEAGKH